VFNRNLVKIVHHSVNNLEGPCGAFTQTGTKPVTVFLAYQPSLAVNKLQRSLSARNDAVTASVAEFFIYFYDFS
jgi:hypothetical protein